MCVVDRATDRQDESNGSEGSMFRAKALSYDEEVAAMLEELCKMVYVYVAE